jgi:glucoamylase
VTTLAAAALCYRRAARAADPAFVARGDAFMTVVHDLMPADGHMAEQLDRNTGAPASARDLTWSYAAFVGAAGLRAEATRRAAARC